MTLPRVSAASMRRALFLALLPLMSFAGQLPSNQPYIEANGIVEGEAENWHFNTVAPSTDEWFQFASGGGTGATFENASNGLFFQCLPDNATPSMSFTTGPSVDFKVQINTPGTYRLYLRWDGFDGASDSLYAGILELNGASHADWYEDAGHGTSDFAQQGWDGLGEAEANRFDPAQNAMTWVIAAPGTYTLRVVGREDGVALDAWRLQLNTLPDPTPVAIANTNAIIGSDDFTYADSALAGKTGGVNWDLDNTTNNGAFVGFTRAGGSTWDNVFGTTDIVSGKLITQNSGAKREYGSPSEGNGAINKDANTRFKQVYYRVKMNRAAGAEWGGLSSYDFGTERIFFGVLFDPGASGQREFGIGENGSTYSGIVVQPNTDYTLVAKIDFVNNIIALWVNPDLTQPEGAPTVTRLYAGANWSSAVRLGSGGSGATTWDDLAVGTSWNAIQRAYPVNTPASGANQVIAIENFDYAGGNIAAQDSGTGWDFDNQTGDGFVGRVTTASNWDNVEGQPYVFSSRLGTWGSSAKREYGPSEANATFSSAATSSYKTLYYRFDMTRGDGAEWSGLSLYDGTNERAMFGVPFANNPASSRRELGIHNLMTSQWNYTGIAPVIGLKYTIIAKADFAAGTLSMWVNPDLSAGEPGTPHATIAFTGTSNALRLGSGGGAPTYWDRLAVTTSWSAMQSLWPAATTASGADVIVGSEAFDYANGNVAFLKGGAGWGFENSLLGDATAKHTNEPSDWDVFFGMPTIAAGKLSTQESAAIRQYNGTSEAEAAVNDDLTTAHKDMYVRFEMTRSAGASWSGISFYDFGNERLLFGVPFAVNPTSGVREFAIHDLALGHSYSGIAPVNGTTYTIVAKLDFANDLLTLWLNPDTTQPESANAPLVTRPYLSNNWNTAIRFGSGGTAATSWDNVSVGTSWRSVQTPFGPPIGGADSITMRPGSQVLLDVLKNDAGAGTVQIVSPPSVGTATVDALGRIHYSHVGTATGSVTLTYQIVGINGQTSAPITVTFTQSTQLKLTNATSAVPLAPPSTGLGVVDALPGVTFTTPTNMAVVPGTNKLVVSERGGKVWLVPDVTNPTPTKQLFIDIAAVVNPRTNEDFEDDGNELGLKGIAFHPQFASNRQFFVTYCFKNGATRYVRLARFTALTNDLNVGDVASEQAFITQLNDETVHNIGSVKFGPDGYLYFICGDEGFTNGVNNSQRIDLDFWSGMFRIDVDRLPANLEPNAHSAIVTSGGTAFYKVPANNPFIGATSLNGVALTGTLRTEFYAMGFRNPWQFNWDSTTSELWGGDVGAELWEEVNVVTAGGNYQWAYKEGNATGWKLNPPPGFTGTPPVWTYPHGGGTFAGNSVTGGVVYRGTKYPSLTDKYVFADFVAGHIWTLVRNGTNPPTVERVGGEAGIVAIGFDPSNGDILMLDYGDGKVRRLTTQTVDTTYPTKLSDTGLFANVSTLTMNPGIEAYSVNLPFWSDHAKKSRWFMVQNPSDQFGYVQDGNWSLPTGSIWIKHFDMEMTRGVPASAKRLETRLLVKNSTGAYGVSYRWNEAQTEAYLVDDNGVDFDMTITVSGSPTTQRWRIPSRAECMACHTPAGGLALSWETRQLNHDGYLQWLATAGYLSNPPTNFATLPKYHTPSDSSVDLETKARSWLAVNCSYCHQSGGTGVGSFSLVPELRLFDTNMIDAHVGNVQNASHRSIVRGLPDSSVIRNRAGAMNGYTRMPPLGSSVIDTEGVQLLTDWISSMTNRSSYTEWRLANFGSSTSPAGDPNADTDHDGQSNYLEYLGAAMPLSGGSQFIPSVSTTASNVSVTVPNLPGRLIKVETSTNMLTWSVWDVINNSGYPTSGPTRTLTAPKDAPQRFFRFSVEEQ